MLETTSKVFNGSASVRFSRVLSDEVSVDAKLPSDVVLHRDQDVIVCPTLGSFLPYWYLIIPTQHYMNFADWESASNERSVYRRINSLVRDVLGDVDNYIWFEHGPTSKGSITGCGVDHAHIHVILDCDFGTREILRAATELGVDNWEQSDFNCVFRNRIDSGEYLAFGDSKTGFSKKLLKPVGSQFFRRALAHLDGKRTDWDYKEFAHQQIAQQSVDRIFNNRVSG